MLLRAPRRRQVCSWAAACPVLLQRPCTLPPRLHFQQGPRLTQLLLACTRHIAGGHCCFLVMLLDFLLPLPRLLSCLLLLQRDGPHQVDRQQPAQQQPAVDHP